MECNNTLGYPGWPTSPKALSAAGLCLWSLLFPQKRDLLFHRRGGTHSVLGNEGAERQHLTNLAVLVKDIIAFSCLFLPPFCERLLPPQHKPGEGSTLLALPTHPRVQKAWSCCQLPLRSISNSKICTAAQEVQIQIQPKRLGAAELSLSASLVWLSLPHGSAAC